MAPAQGWHAKSWSVPNFYFFFQIFRIFRMNIEKVKNRKTSTKLRILGNLGRRIRKSYHIQNTGKTVILWYRKVTYSKHACVHNEMLLRTLVFKKVFSPRHSSLEIFFLDSITIESVKNRFLTQFFMLFQIKAFIRWKCKFFETKIRFFEKV